MGGWGSDVKYAKPAAKLGPKQSGPSETLYNIHVTTILENQTITSKLTVSKECVMTGSVFSFSWAATTRSARPLFCGTPCGKFVCGDVIVSLRLISLRF